MVLNKILLDMTITKHPYYTAFLYFTGTTHPRFKYNLLQLSVATNSAVYSHVDSVNLTAVSVILSMSFLVGKRGP